MAILDASWIFAEELNENSWEGWLDYNKVIRFYNPSNIFTCTQLAWTHHLAEYSLTKTGEYLRIYPNFQTCACCKKDLKDNKHLPSIWCKNMLGYLSSDIIPQSSKFSSWARLSENCSLLRRDNVHEQISYIAYFCTKWRLLLIRMRLLFCLGKTKITFLSRL